MEIPSPVGAWLRWREAGILMLMISVCLLLNLVTAGRTPTVWGDEVQTADPAVNLVLGRGFVSTALDFGKRDELRPPNGLMYTASLFLWLKVFGFSLLSVRSLHYVLSALSGIVLWVGLVRSGWIKSPWLRLGAVALLICGYGITFSVRGIRYDAVGIPFLVAIPLAYAIRCAGLRYLVLGILGAGIALSGIQFGPYAFCVGALILVFAGRRVLVPVASVLAGVCVGYGLMFSVLAWWGLLSRFISDMTRFSQTVGGNAQFAAPGPGRGSLVARIISDLPKALTSYDFTACALLMMAVVLIVVAGVKGRLRWRSPLVFAVTAAVVVPVAMIVVGRYPSYYAFLMFIPLMVALMMALDVAELKLLPGRGATMIAGLWIAMACGVGLPLRLAVTFSEWRTRDYAPVAKLVDDNVAPTDWVYCDFPAFYSCKQRAEQIFLPPYLPRLDDAEKLRINKLVLPPHDVEQAKQVIGGNWVQVAEYMAPASSGPLSRLSPSQKYRLVVLRRAAETGPAR